MIYLINFIAFSFKIYKSVVTSGKKDYIIKFYNKEFHEEMESYIVSNFGRKNEVSMLSALCLFLLK